MTFSEDQSSLDLEECAREPIHIPGAIQPHGALLVFDPASMRIVQGSANARDVLGEVLNEDGLTGETGERLQAALSTWGATAETSFQWRGPLAGRLLQAAAHRTEAGIILEFEAADPADSADALFPRLKALAENLPASSGDNVLFDTISQFIRQQTGFDRVLVYRFDGDWNGHVVGEDGNGVLPSYLGLRFPASDIPAQARQLYKLNRVRIIPDVDYRPVPVEPGVSPLTGAPLDLSLSLLRSVSPIHLEYMRNMGTAASMSISILVGNELWGLVSCHSQHPHGASPQVRNACDFAVQLLSSEISARERSSEASMRLQLADIHSRLLAKMSGVSDWRRALAENAGDTLALVGADSAAIVAQDDVVPIGAVPDEELMTAIGAMLDADDTDDTFYTDSLARHLPEAAASGAIASGLLAIRISELHPSWLLWFRREQAQTVKWGGDPHKQVREAGRIHPRHSFAEWKENVRLTASPWSPVQVEAAANLRAAVLNIVLRRAEELAQLTESLQRSNKELEAFSYSISHDLRAPFRHIVGYAELLREREAALDTKSAHYLESIVESARAAGQLVDDLLNFSHVGRTAIELRNVDMNKLVTEVCRSLEFKASGRDITWQTATLPSAWGDPVLLRQVWFNLIENAIKYTAPRPQAVISIEAASHGDDIRYVVRDNGVGFDMAYKDKLFGVFQRLQRAEDFEGTGIGLALARRIVERHGGQMWAEGELDRGAAFHFFLPQQRLGDAP